MGYGGMPRRYHVYPPEFQIWHVMSSVGAVVLFIAYTLPLIYLGWSLIYGRKAGSNPFAATGLEWQTASPPPKHNFTELPRVTAPPYHYHPERQAPEPHDRQPETAQGEVG